MKRCLELASRGAGTVSPNPMVGAVLVHEGRIIGEGAHLRYGEAHAEVHALANVGKADLHLVPQSTLYVNLEPCAHFGKTPPCADLIVRHEIPRVVIGSRDSFDQVDGRGIERLRAAGIEVVTGVAESECRWLNRRFFCRQEKNRPWVILKWAQSEDGFMAPADRSRQTLSNAYTQRWAHRMRREEDAILVGYRTALGDDPRLNDRFGPPGGRQPLRVVVDPYLKLPRHLHVFDPGQATCIVNYLEDAPGPEPKKIKIGPNAPMARSILEGLPQVQSIIIEGGPATLSHFIREGLWDESYIIKTRTYLGTGIASPSLGPLATEKDRFALDKDTIVHYANRHIETLSANQ